MATLMAATAMATLMAPLLAIQQAKSSLAKLLLSGLLASPSSSRRCKSTHQKPWRSESGSSSPPSATPISPPGSVKTKHNVHILGHEASGVVESVGEGVEDLNEGDHVVPIFNGECKNCDYCKSGKTNLCGEFRVNPFKSVMKSDGRTRFFVMNSDGERRPIYHFLNTSTFAEHTVLDSACVVKIDRRAPLHKIFLLSCGISTGVGAAWNTANVQKGSTVAIFGLGAVGLAVAEGARLRGASRIVGVDVNPEKFLKGRNMGVTDFVNPKDCDKPVHEVIREMIKGGVDFSFECAGNLDVLRDAFSSTHDGWGLTVILGIHTSPKLLPLHPMELFDGRRIVGCVFGDFKGKSQLSDFADKCMSGEININFDGFITHELPFAEINRAFELLQQGKSLRCLLRF